MYVCVLHVCTLEGQTTCVYIKIKAFSVICPVHTYSTFRLIQGEPFAWNFTGRLG